MDAEVSADDLAEARERQRVINAYHRVFASDDGRLVIEDLAAVFGVDAPAFLARPGGSYDALHAALRDGQRMVIVHIRSVLEAPVMGDANVSAPRVHVAT